MQNKYNEGQILRYTKYEKEAFEDDAYFVVLGFKKDEMWIQSLNTSPFYKTGFTIVPGYESEFEPTEINSFHLIHTEVRIKDHLFNEVVTGVVSYLEDSDAVISFTITAGGLESNVFFGMGPENIENPLKGKLFIEFPESYYE